MGKNVVGIKGAPKAAPLLAYHGGPVLQNVEVTTIFWGSAWNSDALRTQLDAFFDFVVQSSLIDQLSEYSVPGQTIGRGTHVASFIVQADPGSIVDDLAIQNILGQLIANGSIPPPNPNSGYFVFMPQGVTVTLQGQQSCQAFCGYHNLSSSGLVYAVDTYDDCAGCQFVPGDTLASSTVVASHELCEMITDPQLNAWFDDSAGNEIGDICEGGSKVISMAGTLESATPTFNVTMNPFQAVISDTLPTMLQIQLELTPGGTPPPPPPPPPTQSWTVQKEWSNAQGACV